MEEIDLIGPNDHPALLAISDSEHCGIVRNSLVELGYKVHRVDRVEQFDLRYNQVNYEVVIIEETFDGATMLEHPVLEWVQNLSMSQRRYAVFFLLSSSLETLNAFQAFSQSIHCIINYAELPMLAELVQKTVADNDLFLTTFRDAQRRAYQKG